MVEPLLYFGAVVLLVAVIGWLLFSSDYGKYE